MARGGYRPGAGRPRSSTSSKLTASLMPGIKVQTSAHNTEVPEIQPGWQTPLEYMLTVLNDPNADPSRRDRLAIAAAPFVHGRPADAKPGKKKMAEEAAKSAGIGSDWGDDLAPCIKTH